VHRSPCIVPYSHGVPLGTPAPFVVLPPLRRQVAAPHPERHHRAQRALQRGPRGRLPERQRLYPVLITPTTADLSYLAQLSADGKLKTTVETQVPYEKARGAWKTSMEGHATGKVVVVVQD